MAFRTGPDQLDARTAICGESHTGSSCLRGAMFFESFAHRQRSDQRSSIGSWNWDRLMRTKFEILQEWGLRDGICLEIGPGEGDFSIVRISRHRLPGD
jgi:hypothetical protein